MAGPELAGCARTMIGTPFRFKGRDERTGVDCIGLVVLASAKAGCTLSLPNSYALRQADFADSEELARSAGLVAIAGPPRPGDIVEFEVSATQRHLAIVDTGHLYIHAHAGLGRVVLGPADPVWRQRFIWRIAQTSHPAR